MHNKCFIRLMGDIMIGRLVNEIANKQIIDMKLFPVLIKNRQVNFAKAEKRDWAIGRMQYLSESFGTTIKDTRRLSFPAP